MIEKDRPWLNSYPPEVSPEIDPHPFESINDLFDYVVRRYADNTAYINMLGHITYDDLRTQVESFAAFLQQSCKLKKAISLQS